MTVANELFCANTPTGARHISTTSANPVMEDLGLNNAFMLMAFPGGGGWLSRTCAGLFIQSGEGEGVYRLCGSGRICLSHVGLNRAAVVRNCDGKKRQRQAEPRPAREAGIRRIGARANRVRRSAQER